MYEIKSKMIYQIQILYLSLNLLETSMKKVFLLSFLAVGVLFSCTEEKKEEGKDDAAKTEEANKAEDAASVKAMDEFSENVKSLETETAALDAELDNIEDIESLLN